MLNLAEYILLFYKGMDRVLIYISPDHTIQCKNDVIVLRKQSDKACESGVQKGKDQ